MQTNSMSSQFQRCPPPRQSTRVSTCFLLIFGLFCSWSSSLTFANPSLEGTANQTKKLKHSIYFPENNRKCGEYIQHYIQRHYTKSPPRYPQTVKGAIAWLKKAKRAQKLLEEPGAVLGHLQTQIDQHQKGNFYLLFGNNHTIGKHYRFFNELWTPGKDGLHLTGVTHLALEAFLTDLQNKPLNSREQRWMRQLWGTWKDRRKVLSSQKRRKQLLKLIVSSQQPLLDIYGRKGQRWAYHLLEVINGFLMGRSYPPPFLRELLRTVLHARNYPTPKRRKGQLQVIASDMSIRIRRRAKHLSCWLYELREIYGLQAVRKRLSKTKRNVVAFMWGSDHVRKQHFPKYISPKDKVYSVRLEGGGAPDIWDRALLRLGWRQRLFAIRTEGAEESDLMIHFPPQGPWLAGDTKIGPISGARLIRNKRGVRLPKFQPLPNFYSIAIHSSLKMMRRPLSFCYRKGRRRTLIRIHVTKTGRVSHVSQLYPNKVSPSWSSSCIQQVLWQLPLPPPPKRQPMDILFLLRYLPRGS